MIIVHLMIREGEPEVTLKYLAQNPHRKLAINSFTEGTFPYVVPDFVEKEAVLRSIEKWQRADGRRPPRVTSCWRCQKLQFMQSC
jgi:hypothetical protein